MKTKTTLLRASLASLGIVATLGMAHASAAGPDPSFGDGGRADLSQVKLLREGLEAMAVGRESIFVSTPRGLISRLDTDGDLDMSFGGGDGTAPAAPFLVRLRERSRVPSLAIQKDGKVVVAGSYGPRPLLSRLTTDGTLDPSFGDRGAILNRKDLYGEKLRAFTDVAIDRTGRILVSGWRWRTRKTQPAYRSFVTRYRPNGKLDRSFGKKGRVLFSGIDSAGVYFSALELTRKGRIIVLRSNSKGDSAIALTRSGRLDRRFAKGKGTLKLPSAFKLDSVPGGRIMAFGVSSGNSSGEVSQGCARLFAFSPAGVLRPGFSGDGKKRICRSNFGKTFPSFGVTPKAIYKANFAVQGNGKPVVTLGLSGKPAFGNYYTFRLDTSGKVDRSFAEAGLFNTGVSLGAAPLAGLEDGVLVNGGILEGDLPREPRTYIYRFGS